MDLTSLVGYRAEEANSIRNDYLYWIGDKRFLGARFRLTWFDLELMLTGIMRDYKVYDNTFIFDRLYDMFYIEYLCIMGGDLSILGSKADAGYKAINFFKKTDDWLLLGDNEVKYNDTFIRCIAYEFKNSKQVKDFMRR